MENTAYQVQLIYIGLLGRAADQAGLDYWVDEIENGVLTIEDLRANIVNEQQEYADGLGSMTRAQVVSQLYANLFNREADPDGLEYWVDGAGAGVNVDQLVLALIEGAAAPDRLVLDNKAEAAVYYTETVGDAYSEDDARDAVMTRATPSFPSTRPPPRSMRPRPSPMPSPRLPLSRHPPPSSRLSATLLPVMMPASRVGPATLYSSFMTSARPNGTRQARWLPLPRTTPSP